MYDPVCGLEIEQKKAEKSEFKEETYYFCSKKCKDEFSETPKKFINRNPIIEIKNVFKDFKLGEVTIPVLRGLSLRIWDNDFVAIIGASGSGKTTAMNIMGCLDTVTKGEIYFGGTKVSDMTENQLAKVRAQKIGFVFQQYNLLGALNCEENIALPLFFGNGGETKENEKNVKKYIEQVGLAHRTNHKPLEMSGGEQQRTAIARSLINNPDMILADEPTGNLDSETGAKILKVLVDLHDAGKTLVIVTHDEMLAKKAHKIYRLQDGKVISVE
jgi:putative ABC transport system ATP-binding protein